MPLWAGGPMSRYWRSIVAARRYGTGRCALRRACPERPSGFVLRTHVDNSNADWRLAFSCGGEIDFVLKRTSGARSRHPTECSNAPARNCFRSASTADSGQPQPLRTSSFIELAARDVPWRAWTAWRRSTSTLDRPADQMSRGPGCDTKLFRIWS